jgi:hypothetical protein
MGTCHVTGLGLPSGPGAECTTAIMNDGKTIGTSGRKYRRAIPTHRNAAQDAGMALGVNLVLRHNFLQEPVTLPTDLVGYFTTRISRSSSSGDVAEDYQSQLESVQGLLRAAVDESNWAARYLSI